MFCNLRAYKFFGCELLPIVVVSEFVVILLFFFHGRRRSKKNMRVLPTNSETNIELSNYCNVSLIQEN